MFMFTSRITALEKAVKSLRDDVKSLGWRQDTLKAGISSLQDDAKSLDLQQNELKKTQSSLSQAFDAFSGATGDAIETLKTNLDNKIDKSKLAGGGVLVGKKAELVSWHGSGRGSLTFKNVTVHVQPGLSWYRYAMFVPITKFTNGGHSVFSFTFSVNLDRKIVNPVGICQFSHLKMKAPMHVLNSAFQWKDNKLHVSVYGRAAPSIPANDVIGLNILVIGH